MRKHSHAEKPGCKRPDTSYTVDDRNQLNSVGTVTYVYDAMGNLQTETGGDNRSCTCDNENRLIMARWGASSYRTEFAYDALSRLRKRTEKFLSGGVWTLIGETRYLYDGMQVVQERDGSNVPTVTYTRGKDLSGSLQGAGGIGGMLSRSHGYSAGSWSTHSYYHADGLGNITRLVNSTNGVVGSYKYDAYGRTISSSGALSGANVYRFSSKMWFYDGTPGYYYFGYRFYQPSLQRWLNRDPLGEPGAINLYQFVYNSPTLVIDHQGLFGDGRTYGSEADPNSEWFGHSDFAGSQWFDYTLEDHDPATAPTATGAPANHFQDWAASLQQALQAITDCEAEAFARAMHRLQDYYTHYGKGYRWDPSRGQFGHAHRLHGPDRDNDAWRRANRTTEILLKRWIQQNGEPTWERTSMPESRRSP